MIKKRDIIGWGLDSHRIDLAHFSSQGKRLVLKNIQQIELPQPLGEDAIRQEKSKSQDSSTDPDDIFGLSGETEEGTADPESDEGPDIQGADDLNDLDLEELDVSEEIDLDNLEMEDEDLDMVDEADLPDSNEQLIYETLIGMSRSKRINIGLNIPSGSAHLHLENDSNYSDRKAKEVREIVREKLVKVHGESATEDSHSHFVDKEGRLWIASLDREPLSLQLFNRVLTYSSRKRMIVRDILPDEMALIGLFRLNYPVEDPPNRITALIQFREHRSRIIFLRGHQIIQVSPIINEGIGDRGVLNTVFSKILFQLDTGEVLGLDRILLCDNRMGDMSVRFFKDNFPDVDVSSFKLDPYYFDIPERLEEQVEESTTSIALAVAGSGLHDRHFPSLSIIPSYVYDRQKFFRLQWHGVLLLIMIGLSPVLLNHHYQENQQQITQLTNDQQRLESLIQDLREPVAEVGRMEEQLEVYQEDLLLMHELSEETIRWTATFDHLHEGLNQVGGVWITSLSAGDASIQLLGIALTEDRIPSLARHFNRATLNQVQLTEIRERSVYQFSMIVDRALHDETLYTPEQSREIPAFLESFTDF